MGDKNRIAVSKSANATQARTPTVRGLVVPAIDVVREGRPNHSWSLSDPVNYAVGWYRIRELHGSIRFHTSS